MYLGISLLKKCFKFQIDAKIQIFSHRILVSDYNLDLGSDLQHCHALLYKHLEHPLNLLDPDSKIQKHPLHDSDYLLQLDGIRNHI